MTVIDAHARLVPGSSAAGSLLAAMDRAGVARAVVSAGGLVGLDELSLRIAGGGRSAVSACNDEVWTRCAASDGRLLPFFFADPYVDVDAYRAGGADFCGLEISPAVHGFRFDDRAVGALVRVAARFGHAVYTVCTGRPGARAGDLASLARSYPGVRFIFGHCGHGGLDVCGLSTVAPLPNIFAETSGCYTATARLAVERLGADRVLFGSEYPLQAIPVELAKLAALGLSPDDHALVAGGNAGRLLGLVAA